LDFARPVAAIALRLLTNFTASEQITFLDASGQVIDSVSVDALTSPNTRQFLGFISVVPFSSVIVSTVDGGTQNEGIDMLFAGDPCASDLDLGDGKGVSCFRDVRRAGDINAGVDLGGTGHSALNFTGSAGSAGDTWLTMYDETPNAPGQTIFTGNVA